MRQGEQSTLNSFDPPTPATDPVQQKLQASLERFRTLAESSFDLVAEVDAQGVYQYLSPNHRHVLGWDIDSIVGKSSLDFVHPDQRKFVEQRLRQAAVEGGGSAEIQVRDGNGQWRWFESTGKLFHTPQGEVRFALISRDTTARHDADDRVKKEQEFQRRLVLLQDADRRLMAYEIHDGLVQDLYGALLFLDALKAESKLVNHDLATFQSAVQLLRGAIEEARRLINGLRPPVLDEQGLVAAIEHLANDMEQTWDLTVNFSADVAFDRLTPTIENAIYRIVQESLNNVQKHAGVTEARVRLKQEGELIHICVEDHGKGFQPEETSEKSYGLAGVRDRARILGGSAEIDSQPGAGTTVRVILPLTTPEVL